MGELAAAFVNDLETPALECSESLRVIKAQLLEREGFRAVTMLGAGPSLAAIGPRPPRDKNDEAFGQRLARDLSLSGIDLQVRRVQFASRASERWYE